MKRSLISQCIVSQYTHTHTHTHTHTLQLDALQQMRTLTLVGFMTGLPTLDWQTRDPAIHIHQAHCRCDTGFMFHCPPVLHSVWLLLLYGALDSHPFFPSHV